MTNGFDILEKMSDIDNRLIENADMQKKRSYVPKIIAAAACFCLVLCGAVFLNSDGSRLPGSSGDENIQQGEGVAVPQLMLPETDDGTEVDMIGLVVYKGSIYTYAGMLDNTDGEYSSLIGEYIGKAKGNIDEWSTQDEYATELASTMGGMVYKANGYDDSFRLLCINSFEEDGENKEIINIIENLNGITLETGADLFESRLGISEHTDYMARTYDSWNNSTDEYFKPSLSQDEIDSFIEKLNSGSFVDKTRTNLYELPSAFLYFEKSDGTKISLRLFEGGYVTYQHLGWYCVKIEDLIFDTVFNACR